MQLSAANLLIASQQQTRTQGPAPQDPAKFAQALAKEAGAAAPQAFSPLPLKQTSMPAPSTQAAAPASARNYAPTARPGSQLDIRI